jgi:hypothetical protein
MNHDILKKIEELSNGTKILNEETLKISKTTPWFWMIVSGFFGGLSAQIMLNFFEIWI